MYPFTEVTAVYSFNLGPRQGCGDEILSLMIKRVTKRDGRVVEFNNQKIVAAILKAMAITEKGEDIVLAAKIADTISKSEKEEIGRASCRERV